MDEKLNTSPTLNPRSELSIRTFLRAAAYLLLPPILLFGGAGTLNWPIGWAYLILTVGGVVLSRILVARVHPDLMAERAKSMESKDVPGWDRKLAPIISTWVPMTLMLVAGLDKRFGWTQPGSLRMLIAGTLLIAAAIVLATWAMVTNRYFSAFVRLQSDRGHRVVESGPYAVIRHPGYAAGILTNIGAPLMLGALWAFLPAILGIIVILWRTTLEDRFLHAKLAGYPDYSSRVRWRILPFIW